MSSKRPPHRPPSVFTPFLRRFTDERARDLSDTIRLYNQVRANYLRSPWAKDDALTRIASYVAERVGTVVAFPSSRTLLDALDRCQQTVLSLETTIFLSPNVRSDIASLTLKEQVDLRRFLRAQQYFLDHDDRISDLLIVALGNVLAGIVRALPGFPTDCASIPFTVPLITLMRDPGDTVDRIIGTICKQELAEVGLFTSLQAQFHQNVCLASGISPEDEKPRRPPITAADSELPPMELVESYLSDTPFLDLFLSPIPFSIPEAARFEHAHIIAGSGHGKTQLLQHLILSDLQAAEPPALVVIDSQGDMLGKIQRLSFFDPDVHASFADRLVIIDAEDVEYPPALNMFSVPSSRLSGYTRRDREQIEAGTIELFNYIFGALAAELTQKQGTAFAYVTRLMLSIPGATIHTLRQLMEDVAPSVDKSPFAEHIHALDSTSRAFFENQFYNRGAFGQTKQQIARRLYGVLQVPAFDRMFSSPVNKLDMFAALQAGSIVLINTSKALLKSDASALFGRYMIALTLHAAFERVAVEEKQRRPASLIVDEAAEYFDESLDSLLSQARKFKLGVLFAHQYLDQLTPALRASVASNTSIKLAGGVSDRDARALAPDMRTSADFITSMHKDGTKSTEFACYIRNQTTSAVRLQIPFGTLERAPQMSKAAHERLIAVSRARYASHPSDGASQPTRTRARPENPPKPPRADPDDAPPDAATTW